MWLKKIIINACIFIIGVVVIDLALAQAAKRLVPSWRSVVMEKEARILVSPYHHGLKPYADFEHSFGNLRVPYFTNSLGFRDASPRKVTLQRKGRRVLIIGDSITEGVGVAYEKTFAGLIAKEIEEDGGEVLNAAVQTYAHLIYFAKIVHFVKTVGVEISEVIAFVDIGDIANDVTQYKFDDKGNVVRIDSNCRYGIGCRWRPMKRFKFWLADNSNLYRFYKEFKKYRRESKMRGRVDSLTAATNLVGARWTFLDSEFQEYAVKGMEIADRTMSKLNDFLSGREIGLTIAVYPPPDQIVQKDLDSKHVKFWRDWSARNNAKFINLFPAFIDGRDPKEVVGDYFIPYNYHLSERGHELIARKVIDQMEK
jgi:hypothetical protein